MDRGVSVRNLIIILFLGLPMMAGNVAQAATKVINMAIGEIVIQDVPRITYHCVKSIDADIKAVNALNDVITLTDGEIRDDGLTGPRQYACGGRNLAGVRFQITFGCANDTHYAKYTIAVPPEEITAQLSPRSQSSMLQERMARFCKQFGRQVYRAEPIETIVGR